MSNEYLQQAKDFLNATNSQLDIIKVPDAIAEAPDWSTGEHGTHYKAKLTRNGQTFMFDFWGSVHDRLNHKRPTVYDVLACLNPNHSEEYSDLADFMQYFGYEVKDLKSAEKSFNAIKHETAELRKLYSEDELNQLSEIQ